MIGMDGEIGAISKGLVADIIVVDGDPMADTKVLLDTTNIHTVFQSGKRVAKRGHLII
jgi:imidazolonepropionase-like amidohydrolase